jgi:tetratricopeptide (TPR) repeat protein
MKAVHARNEKEAKRFYQMALQKFKTALVMEPDHVDSLLQIFDAVVFLGFNNVAQSLYNTLSSIDPKNFLFLYKYAVFCEKIKNFEKAEENYLSSLEQNPGYILSLIAYAKFMADVYGDFETAER